MKYVKTYSTIAQATADTTAVSPLLAFCSENAQVFNLMGGGIDTPLEISAQDGIISVQEKPILPSLTILGGWGPGETTIQYEEGMTWSEWVASDYNTVSARTSGTRVMIGFDTMLGDENYQAIDNTSVINPLNTYRWCAYD